MKKYFPVILITLFAIAIFTYLQKNNSSINKLLNSKNKETTKSGGVEIKPTNSTIAKSEKIFLQVNEPKSNITVNDPIINISGKTISNTYVFINEQELRADMNGNFASATTLDEGENYILIVVSDDLGNSVEKDILVNLETKQ